MHLQPLVSLNYNYNWWYATIVASIMRVSNEKRRHQMNIETANRLMELRKAANLSQEELAEKLNISRQAVSKWERAESAPDMENLIALSKLYQISMDEMLNLENTEGIARKEENEMNNFEKQAPLRKKQIALAAIAAMLAMIFFTVNFFVFNNLHVARLGFFIIPIFWFLPVLFNKEKE